MRSFLLTLVATYTLVSTASASDVADTAIKKTREPIQKFYVGGALDGALFSTAIISRAPMVTVPGTPGATSGTSMGTLRFSYVANFGFSFNFNFGRHFGAFTGIDLKNLGFIENVNSFIVKRRVYNLGVPIGIKVGNMERKGMFLFLGGGADAPVNYREKSFTIRDQKTKLSEWFSERTPQIMPYAFVGVSLKNRLTLKAQYYPNNFLNPNFTDKNGSKPYAGYDVHVMQLSLGYAMRYGAKQQPPVTKVTELKTM